MSPVRPSDALQVRMEQRAFSNGESAIGAMTWVYSWTFSKEYSFLCCAGPTWINGDDNFRYQMDSNNKTQELAFSGVWAMPFGKGKHFGSGVSGVPDKLASGWRIDYILTYISGFPVGLPNLINYCGNWANGSAQNQFHWFNNNPSCYAQFPLNAGALSYLPPRFSGNVNNPAAPQLHLALVKETAFKDRYKLTFRAESFNLTNTAIRPGPGTGFPSTTFGVLPESEQNFPRLVQLALKLYF